MNYINLNNTVHALSITLKKNVGPEPINFAIYQDGGNDILYSFQTTDVDHFLINNGYYWNLVFNTNTNTLDIDDEKHYRLIGKLDNGEVVHYSKFYTTAQDLEVYTLNKDKYKPNTSSNSDYIFLD